MEMSDVLMEEMARRFALLGDPTRLRILHTLMEHGEMPVAALAAAAGTSRVNASAHLARLAQGGLVGLRRHGTAHYYQVVDQDLSRICSWMCESLRARARALNR